MPLHFQIVEHFDIQLPPRQTYKLDAEKRELHAGAHLYFHVR